MLYAKEAIRFAKTAITIASVAASVLFTNVAGAQTIPRAWQAWTGPMPFSTGAIVRSDFHYLWDQPTRWTNVKATTDVFKTYINILQTKSASNPNGLTNAELSSFVASLNGKKVAFETRAAIAYYPSPCGATLGETTWTHDNALFQRWIAAGGTIDYITSEHAIAENFFDPTSYGGPSIACSTMSLQDIVREIIDYFVLAKQTYPNAKLGIIESLGFWKFVSLQYGTFNPTSPLTHGGSPSVVELATVLNEVATQASQRGVTIDHFDVDYGKEGVEYDGGYGRILATESIVHSHNWKLGIIANAFPKAGDPDPNISARDRTILFLQGYFKTTALPDKIVFQQWHPYPNTLGSETDGTGTSSLSLINNSIFHWAYPGWLATGEYRSFATIFKVTSSSTYCMWTTWPAYLAAHGGNGDVSRLVGYGSLPSKMTYTGSCP